MIRPYRIAAACIMVLSLPIDATASEQLISTIAPARISVASNYGGSSIVVFGAIQAARTPQRPYDVVVTVTGPSQTVMARRKERVAGLWINVGSRLFSDVPSFLSVAANRPFDAIANEYTLHQQQVGLKNVIFALGKADETDSYLVNLLQIRTAEKLYNEQTNAVTFLSRTAFRADIPIPKDVLIGAYDVDLKLFSNGAKIAQTSSTFDVVKVGVEEFVASAAVDYSLLYGLSTMAMALMTGWLASIVFRRD